LNLQRVLAGQQRNRIFTPFHRRGATACTQKCFNNS
jgi:hypothetical protein